MRLAVGGLIICIIFNYLLSVVVFIQQYQMGRVANEQHHVPLDERGHRRGCYVTYDGYAYKREGPSCQ